MKQVRNGSEGVASDKQKDSCPVLLAYVTHMLARCSTLYIPCVSLITALSNIVNIGQTIAIGAVVYHHACALPKMLWPLPTPYH